MTGVSIGIALPRDLLGVKRGERREITATLSYIDSCLRAGTCASIDADCGLTLSGGQAVVVVLDRTGDTAPFPKLVSSDFRATYEIQITMPVAITGERGSQSKTRCTEAVRVSANLILDLKAADFRSNAEARCVLG